MEETRILNRVITIKKTDPGIIMKNMVQPGN
jgi:hypothetical protein